MTILTNKRKFFRNTYEGRVDASLIMEYGDHGLGLIMRVTGNNLRRETQQSGKALIFLCSDDFLLC